MMPFPKEHSPTFTLPGRSLHMAKHGLGRGLDSLFESDGPEKKEEVYLIPCESITVNPYQPRKIFREEEIKEMAQSLLNHGLLQPIVVTRKKGDRESGEYILISGERRLRAAKLLAWEAIPAIERSVTDKDLLELALIENLQRSDLNPIEIAEGFNRLIEEFHWTQEKLAQNLGMKRSTVANFLRILTLSPETIQKIENGVISLGHAKVLLGVKDPKELSSLAEEIVQKKMSVRDLEQRISNKKEKKDFPAWAEEGKEKLKNYFSRPVSITRTGKKIRFAFVLENEEDLTRLIHQLSESDNPGRS
ncbi:ParB/RepB/Spo0J family partition protein [Leptospirillum ferriphilum]|nr:ParB/RepB/Spo0J family partition protein [Leptospirillum ferriphilum]